eukprot:747014-Hanusia_phi.AAC.1
MEVRGEGRLAVHQDGDRKSVDLAWNGVDWIATALCLSGILIAFTADNELYRLAMLTRLVCDAKVCRYMKSNEDREKRGQNKWLVGTESTSQLLWRNLVVDISFSVLLQVRERSLVGEWQMVGGTIFNTSVLVYVAQMTEDRMLKGWTEERAKRYRRYISDTPCIVPNIFKLLSKRKR